MAVKVELLDGDRAAVGAVVAFAKCGVVGQGVVAHRTGGGGGVTNKAIREALGTDRNKGRLLEAGRFADAGPDGIAKERPCGANHGGKSTEARAPLRSEVIRLTSQTDPPDRRSGRAGR